MLGTSCVALTLGTVKDAGDLGRYGASRVVNIADAGLDHFDSQAFSASIAAAAENLGATLVILSHSSTGKSIAGRLAVRLKAGLVSGAYRRGSRLPQVPCCVPGKLG